MYIGIGLLLTFTSLHANNDDVFQQAVRFCNFTILKSLLS